MLKRYAILSQVPSWWHWAFFHCSGIPMRRSALTKNGLENQFTLSAPLFPASHSRWCPSKALHSWLSLLLSVLGHALILFIWWGIPCFLAWSPGVFHSVHALMHTHLVFFLFQRPLLLFASSFPFFLLSLFSFSFLYLQSVLRILQVLDSTSQRVGVATLICQDLV